VKVDCGHEFDAEACAQAPVKLNPVAPEIMVLMERAGPTNPGRKIVITVRSPRAMFDWNLIVKFDISPAFGTPNSNCFDPKEPSGGTAQDAFALTS
jgi:hypothetical protein